MRAQEGATEEAALALETWLEASYGDPRVSAAQHTAAEIDLGMLLVLAGHPGDARELLLLLEGNPVMRGRRLMILAAAEEGLGDIPAALDAARRAEGAAPDDFLPVVQQALLNEGWLERSDEAERLWAEVVERSAGRSDLAALLQTLRARILLERAEVQRTQEAESAAMTEAEPES